MPSMWCLRSTVLTGAPASKWKLLDGTRSAVENAEDDSLRQSRQWQIACVVHICENSHECGVLIGHTVMTGSPEKVYFVLPHAQLPLPPVMVVAGSFLMMQPRCGAT